MANNINSVNDKISRYVNGGTTEVGTKLEWWERKKLRVSNDGDNSYVLEKIYEHRPDKLSAVFYNESRYWWVLMQYNGILDIETEFVEGVLLTMPSLSKLESIIRNNKEGGVTTTRESRSTPNTNNK